MRRFSGERFSRSPTSCVRETSAPERRRELAGREAAASFLAAKAGIDGHDKKA
jgi:hypothetical protein